MRSEFQNEVAKAYNEARTRQVKVKTYYPTSPNPAVIRTLQGHYTGYAEPVQGGGSTVIFIGDLRIHVPVNGRVELCHHNDKAK